MSSNYIKNIAIVGAGGQSGSYIANALIATSRFNITAITRPDSTSKLPEGLTSIAKVSYDDTADLISALRGQDCLIITMSVFAGPEASKKLIRAAAEAGVPWVMPNEWGIDQEDDEVSHDSIVGDAVRANRKLITDLGVSSYIAFVCSFWYEYSLTSSPAFYGFDWANRKVTFFDRGDTKINTTTWAKVGKGVAALLSLPVHRAAGETGAVLDDFRNGSVRVSSFRLTQREMFEAVLRVTGAKEVDWTVEYEDVKERYARGYKDFKAGDWTGLGLCLYSRLFYPNAPGDYESRGLLDNELLGLEQEDLDERTRAAAERYAKEGHLNFDGLTFPG